MTHKLPAPSAHDRENLPNAAQQFAWTPEQKVVAHRNMHVLFPFDPINVGGKKHEFQSLNNMEFEYSNDGQLWSVDTYLTQTGSTGLIAIKDNQVILEKYTSGNDKSTLWASRSVAKSFTSTLVGIALKDGSIKSLDDKIPVYVPELKGTLYDSVTIRHCLQMVSGIPYNEDYLDSNSDVAELQKCTTMNQVGAFMEFIKKLGNRSAEDAKRPGTVFNYASVETVLLGIVLERATGSRPAEFLQERIWIPFGMSHDAFWNLEAEGGTTFAASGIGATLRDYARFGQFILNEGVLPDGTKTLPDWWMDEALTATAPSIEEGSPYGFQWWLHSGGGVPSVKAGAIDPALGEGAEPVPVRGGDTMFYAIGNAGQTIAINRQEGVVIVKWAVWDQPWGKNDRGRYEDVVLFSNIIERAATA